MRKTKSKEEVPAKISIRPALTPESREEQLIGLAIDQAERMLLEGNAPTQVIVHYLKLGTRQHRTEIKALEKEIELKDARIKALEGNENIKQLYEEALKSFKLYSGSGSSDEQQQDY